MAGVIEFVGGVAVDLCPWLLEIPVVGQLLAPFAANPATELHAAEELQKQADSAKQVRQRTRDRNNKNVIKVNVAMDCVDRHLGDGALLWTLIKSLAKTIVGTSTDGADVMINQIYQCLEENALRHDTPRVTRTKKYPSRPARGHGHGR